MPNPAVTEAINLAASGQDLTSEQAQNVLAVNISGHRV